MDLPEVPMPHEALSTVVPCAWTKATLTTLRERGEGRGERRDEAEEEGEEEEEKAEAEE